MTGKWVVDRKWYELKRAGHKPLWDFIAQFIKDKGIRSMLEIGGGHGYNSELVERYTNVEVNPVVVQEGRLAYPEATFVVGKWVEDVGPWGFTGQFDLVLAAAVVEHCPGYQKFIAYCLAVRPKHVIITFHRSLNREHDRIGVRACQDPPGKFFDNKYSRETLERFLHDHGLDGQYEIFDKPRVPSGTDSVLVLTPKEPPAESVAVRRKDDDDYIPTLG